MSKSLILDWQKNSLLLARAHGRLPKATIDAVALQAVGNTETVSQTASEALRAAAQQLNAKGEVCVLVARELVEMRTVQIPKIDADEQPDVIRFQAQRQFANMSDAWTVDFVLLPASGASEMQTALVAAISPAQLNEIESCCAAAGLQVTSIGLRPLQIVHMAVESGLLSGSGRAMIVCVTESVADLLIIREGKVLQVRSTKLPYEADHVGPALQGEVRRSLVAAASELEGQPLDSVLLVASANRSENLLTALKQATGANVVQFHPETVLSTADTALADSAGSRLAAMAGALGLQSADRAIVIDFKNPKRRPPKKRDSRKWLLVGGAAATVIVAAVGWYYSTISSLDNDYALIKEELDAKKDSGESARKRLAEFEAIEKFASDAPNWLDELVYVSQTVPASEQIMLTGPSFSIGRNGIGVIDVSLKASDTDSISKFGESLKGESYTVKVSTTQELPKPEGRYRFSGNVKIEVSGKGWNLSSPQLTNSTQSPSPDGIKPQTNPASALQGPSTSNQDSRPEGAKAEEIDLNQSETGTSQPSEAGPKPAAESKSVGDDRSAAAKVGETKSTDEGPDQSKETESKPSTSASTESKT